MNVKSESYWCTTINIYTREKFLMLRGTSLKISTNMFSHYPSQICIYLNINTSIPIQSKQRNNQGTKPNSHNQFKQAYLNRKTYAYRSTITIIKETKTRGTRLAMERTEETLRTHSTYRATIKNPPGTRNQTQRKKRERCLFRWRQGMPTTREMETEIKF